MEQEQTHLSLWSQKIDGIGRRTVTFRRGSQRLWNGGVEGRRLANGGGGAGADRRWSRSRLTSRCGRRRLTESAGGQ